MAFQAQGIRHLFPSLALSTPAGRQPIFFDNPAGTQVPQPVIDAVGAYYRSMNANSGGSFLTSRRNDAMAAQLREYLADFLNAGSADEIVLGANMTSLNFALSRSIANTLSAGDEIVITRMDHDANIMPWLTIARERQLRVKWVDFAPGDCTLDMASLEAALGERTKLVAAVHASNAVGTVNPVAQIADMAHAAEAICVVDAVQSAPHLPLDVQAIGCDFLLCSAYKFYGPHVGIMWGRPDLLESLPVYKVRPAKDQAPHRWENGTPSYETWNALLACLKYWEWIGREFGDAELPAYQGRRLLLKRALSAVRDYERELASQLIAGLRSIPGVSVAGISEPHRFHLRVPTVSLVKRGIAPDDLARRLTDQDVFVWSGDYYARETMIRLNRPQGMVRVGLAQYNTPGEVDRLLELIDGFQA